MCLGGVRPAEPKLAASYLCMVRKGIRRSPQRMQETPFGFQVAGWRENKSTNRSFFLFSYFFEGTGRTGKSWWRLWRFGARLFCEFLGVRKPDPKCAVPRKGGKGTDEVAENGGREKPSVASPRGSKESRGTWGGAEDVAKRHSGWKGGGDF